MKTQCMPDILPGAFTCFLFVKINFIYLFLAVLGLRCCMGFSLVAASRGYSLVTVCGLLIVVAFLVVEHTLSAHGLQCCSSGVLEPRLNSCGELGVVAPQYGDLPRPEIEPGSLTLAGGFFATEPLGKLSHAFLNLKPCMHGCLMAMFHM